MTMQTKGYRIYRDGANGSRVFIGQIEDIGPSAAATSLLVVILAIEPDLVSVLDGFVLAAVEDGTNEDFPLVVRVDETSESFDIHVEVAA